MVKSSSNLPVLLFATGTYRVLVEIGRPEVGPNSAVPASLFSSAPSGTAPHVICEYNTSKFHETQTCTKLCKDVIENIYI